MLPCLVCGFDLSELPATVELPRDLAQRFDHPSVLAIALLGSHARGDAGPFSDVDLLRLLAGGDAAGREAGEGTKGRAGARGTTEEESVAPVTQKPFAELGELLKRKR